jgi:PIN domain nuclease of toxin-antitoxin system
MKYLLDTHTFIWSLVDETKLTNKTRVLLSTAPQVYVSIVSLWEISIKFGIGKLELEGSNPEDIWKKGEQIGFRLLPLAPMDVLGFHKLERLHKDAFDRMIIWQAIKNSMTLVSKDTMMSQYEKFGLDLIW